MDRVIELILKVGNLPAIGPDQDFYDAGFSSIRALQLLTELEDEFNVTIPDDRFPAARTPRALLDIIQELQ
ncbi:MAG: acyl carrier protein [Polyangiaceae bacterium]|nr:acyl carrier protein [Polyangiaceae bacterium]